MDEQAILSALLELLRGDGVEVRYAASASDSHPGGAMVKLRGREILFLDPSAGLGDRLAIAAAACKGRPALEDVYLSRR